MGLRCLQGLLDVLMLPLTFLGKLANGNDHTVEAQELGFCAVVIFGIYWLDTRQQITTGWASCFTALVGLVTLKYVFDRHNGGMQ
jgi:hypothetical protein